MSQNIDNSSVVNMNNSDMVHDANKVKSNKLRRAFSLSMPRNPFGLSRRIKITSDKEENSEFNCQNVIKEDNQNSNDNKNSRKKVFRRSSWKKFINRIAQQMTSVSINANQSKTDRVPPINGNYVWPPDTVPGVIGLRNHGNTCFMNAVLQCLSHTDILAEYFVLDQYKADLKRRNKINAKKFGTKGELTEQLALVLKALWTCKDAPEYSTSFKAVVDRYGSQFRSSTQHDAQEFLFWLLDKVHEDLNTATKRKYKTIKNNYGRSDEIIAAETLANHIRCNNSFVQAVFQAQFRSSLACPRCHKQSNTFDPFHCISVQLPQLTQQAVFVKVIYSSQQPKQVNLGLGIPHGSPVVALREQLQADTGIALERIILAEIGEHGFNRVFCDSHTMSSICETDPIYCIESPHVGEDSTQLILCLANVKRYKNDKMERFGTPFCIQVNRDISYSELQKLLLKEMSSILKSEVFAFNTPIVEMFKLRLQDPSCDPDTYLEPNVEHPLFTEIIDLALSVLPTDAGPSHVKLLIEWSDPAMFFADVSDPFVEHESVSQMKEKMPGNSSLTLEQCLEHYTKAETLSAEDAWRCPHCQKYLPVVKTLGLWSLPDILVIHFKRFRQQQLKGPQAAKLTTMVKFPLHGFDMSPHLARDPSLEASNGTDDNWSPWRKTTKRNSSNSSQMENRYDLYAVCYHQGDTLETGHYTAACKNPYDHQWYKFDDQKVNQVPSGNVAEEIINNEAYILFYQRRKVDGSECSGTSSSSGGDHWVSKIAATTIVNSISFDKPKLEPNPVVVVLESSIEDEDEQEIKHSEEIIEKNNEILVEEVELEEEITEAAVVEQINPIDEQLIANEVSEEAQPENIIQVEAVVERIQEEIDKELCVAEKDENVIRVEEEKELVVEEAPVKVEERKIFTHKQVTMEEQKKAIRNHTNRHPTIHEILWNENLSEIISNRQSSSSNYKSLDSDTISMIRGASSCSKDTLLFIDQQTHNLLDDEDDDLLGSSRALWISPVTPHKLITVSPKN